MLAPRFASLLRSAACGLRSCSQSITNFSATTTRTISSGHKPSDIEALNKELDEFFGAANPQQYGSPPWDQQPNSSSSTTTTSSSSSSRQAQSSGHKPQPRTPAERSSASHDWPRIHPPIYQAPLSRQAGANNPLQNPLPTLPAFPTPIAEGGAHAAHPQPQHDGQTRTSRDRRSKQSSSSSEDDRDFGDLLAVTAHGYAGGSTGDGAVTLGSPGVTAYDALSHQQQQEVENAGGLQTTAAAAAEAGLSWVGPQPTAAARSGEVPSSSSSSSSTGGDTGLSHVDATGRASMVDVSPKAVTRRSATASCRVLLGPQVYALVQGNQLQKGDVLRVAQLAGVMGAKHTALLIPLCHNLFLSKVEVQLQLQQQDHSVRITATAVTVGQTGVEMEALTAASVAALTVYDMCKAASKDICITDLQLEAKEGGRSGSYTREPPAA